MPGVTRKGDPFFVPARRYHGEPMWVAALRWPKTDGVCVGKRSQAAKTRSRGSRAARASRARGAGVVVPGDLPAISELSGLPDFCDVCPDEEQLSAFDEERCAVAQRMGDEYADSLRLGCVVRLDRGFPLVACEGITLRCEHAVGFAKGRAAKEGVMPTVGDWVAAAVPADHDMGVIEAVLPRRCAFARWRGGRRAEFQTLAANLDEVVVVAPLGSQELALDRIARSLVLARDCGVVASVVLTKADRKASEDDLALDVARVRRLVGDDVRVVVSSSARGQGIDEVRALVPERSVAMILGESGAGKSTLLNALLGRDALATGAVRERDDMGRHTTVSRMMVKLPGAGVICDAPGLRSLPLVGHERGLVRAFSEVAERAQECKFRDCTHEREPGCAVREALEAGELDELRAGAYLALAAEMRASEADLDPDIVL